MAQWLGQYGGKTHLTKVKDREHQLRHAVEILGTKQSHADQRAYMNTVLRFAEGVYQARLRALKGRLAAFDPRDLQGIEAEQRKIDQLSAEGVPGILREFQVDASVD